MKFVPLERVKYLRYEIAYAVGGFKFTFCAGGKLHFFCKANYLTVGISE